MLTTESLNVLQLSIGAIKHKEIVHNGGWYNNKGEKIGWGDLNENDFYKIQANLQPGELFVVLGETDSYWNFVYPNTHNYFGGKEYSMKSPGIQYVADFARWIITKEKVYYIEKSNYPFATNLPRDQVKAMLESSK